VLIEQTIGRGLRLPFGGERTGEKKLDQLTVIAHDNFQKVIEEAQKPDSILNKMSLIELDNLPSGQKQQVVVTPTVFEQKIQEEEKRIQTITSEVERTKLKSGLDAQRAIIAAINHPEIVRMTSGTADLSKPEVRKEVIRKATEIVDYGQQSIFQEQIRESISGAYDPLIQNYREHHIDIPRLLIEPAEQKVWFEDFDLDTSSGFELTKLNEEIQRVNLMDRTDVEFIGVQQGAYVRDTPVNQVIAEMLRYPEVDYSDNAALLQKLATQAVQKIESALNDSSELPAVIRQYRRVIGGRIYEQLMTHFRVSTAAEQPPQVLPYTKIEPWNLSRLDGDGYKDYRESIQPKSHVPRYIFTGFKRACHPEYKFDSSTEKDFAWVLEHDKTVLCWMRPAPSQFRIYWSHNSRQYYPDFIVETKDAIYMVETKAENELKDPEVLDKKAAGEKYCRYASEYNQSLGKKPWRYVLVGSDRVDTTKSFLGVVG
jgi:type III restriction enzyme